MLYQRMIRFSGLLVLLLAPLATTFPLTSNAMELASVSGEPLTLSGWVRFRDYTWSYFNPGSVSPAFGDNNQYNYPALVMRLGVGYRYRGVKVFIEGENPTLFALPDDAVAPAPKGALGLGANYYVANKSRHNSNVFLKQGYVSLGEQLLPGLDVKGGRFEFVEGADLPVKDRQIQWISQHRIAQRLIGNFGWSDVMRSFDGARVLYGGENWNALVFYGVPTRGVFDLNGMDEISPIDVLYAALNAFQSEGALGNSLGRVFYIWYDDNRGLVPVDNEPHAAGNRRSVRIDTIGGDFVHDVRLGPGTADLMAWGVYQWGSWGKLAQSAYAATVEAGYRFNSVAWTPWLRAGYDMSSGDGDTGDGVHGTFFQILPTPRIYALDPTYNMMNVQDALAEMILFPRRSMSVRATLHGLWLSSSQDRWYYGGGAFNNTAFGYVARPSFGKSYLGTVADASFNWKVTSYLSLDLYGGHMFGGSVVGANFPDGREESFGYLETIFKF